MSPVPPLTSAQPPEGPAHVVPLGNFIKTPIQQLRILSSRKQRITGVLALVRQINGRETTEMSTADATIEEAQSKLRKLVEFEKGLCGGHVPTALGRATSRWGVEPGAVNSLWKRKSITFVKAHILERLRQIDAVLQASAERQRTILEETAESLERHGHPAAGVARMAANAVREKV